MKTLPREEANAVWNKWWDELQSEWFKLEVLQDYAAEDEGPSLSSWLKGDKDQSIKLLLAPDNISRGKEFNEKTKQGVKLLRIHIVEEPYTPYIQWELQHYKHVNVPLWGEEVYLINRLKLDGLNIPNGDLMIFDQKRTVVNKYDNRGLMTHETFYDHDDDITQFLALRKALIELTKTAEKIMG